MSLNTDFPIGVFDSGVGGLTVLKALTHKFPHENFLYLGDTARLPYGSKSPQTIRKYTQQALSFLIERKVKALVIACNSASSQFPEKEYRGICVETVIEPGSLMALKATQNNRIGVLGTRATVQSHAYEKVLKQLSEEQGHTQGLEVFSEAAPLFVPLAEEGWSDDPITNLIAFRYVQPLVQKQVDTIILGCTHYPILQASIQKAAGASITLIDSGQAVAESLQAKFDSGIIPLRPSTSSERHIQLLSTDLSSQFEMLSRQILAPAIPSGFEFVEI
jgi:glutamate racemase